MKLLILTPLFPPDTTPAAQYVKELATRLREHEVTVLLFGHLPESTPGAKLVSVDKRQPIFKRIISYTKQLNVLVRNTDFIIIQNGISTELPSLLVLWLKKTPFIIMESDAQAKQKSSENLFSKVIYEQLRSRAKAIIVSEDDFWPSPRPLIHPLKDYPQKEMQAYEESWTKHFSKLNSFLINHV